MIPEHLPFFNPLSMTPEQVAKVEAEMRPGRSSQKGFLGQTDSLVEWYRKDAQTLKQLNITYKQIANKLDGLVGRTARLLSARRNFSAPALLEDKFLVRLRPFAGHQDCPFPCDFDASSRGSYDVTVENTESGQNLKFPGLMIHLIREHGFFEGDTPYRLDPALACSVLELKSGEDYTPEKVTSYRYQQLDNFDNQDKISEIKSKWLKVLETQKLGEGTSAYLVEVPADPKEPSEIERGGKIYHAKMYIHNTTGEKLPREARIFGIELRYLFRASSTRDLLEFQIQPQQEYVLDEEDGLGLFR